MHSNLVTERTPSVPVDETHLEPTEAVIPTPSPLFIATQCNIVPPSSSTQSKVGKVKVEGRNTEITTDGPNICSRVE